MKLVERTPPSPRLRFRAQRGPWSRALSYFLARILWAWRMELAAVVAVITVASLLLEEFSAGVAVVIGAGMIVAVLGPVEHRAVLKTVIHRSSVRRHWARAVRHAGLETANERLPRIVRQRLVSAGDLLHVRMPAGQGVADLQDHAERLAAGLRVQEVRVLRHEHNARFASVTLVRRDPLAGTVALSWPNLDAQRLSLWEPIPVGVGEDGEAICVSVVERNVLIGGEPGAGKSVAESELIATAALDPEVDLTLFDGKLVELAPWRGVARAVVGLNIYEAIDVLRELRDEMNARYERLLAEGKRKISRGDGMRLHLVAMDELALYLSDEDRKAKAELFGLARDLVARGRAAGIIFVVATQKPSGDVVPTALRDLVAIRWALRCSTRDASDTILGAGWATKGVSAASIGLDQRGVGYLLAEGALPVRLRSYYLSDEDLARLAERAKTLRAAWAKDHPGQGPGLAVVA
jgi:hypothetical protein